MLCGLFGGFLKFLDVMIYGFDSGFERFVLEFVVFAFFSPLLLLNKQDGARHEIPNERE